MTNYYQSHASWPKVRVVEQLESTEPEQPDEPPVEETELWQASKVYYAGDRVTYQGVVYQVKWWSQGDVPTAGDPWMAITQP